MFLRRKVSFEWLERRDLLSGQPNLIAPAWSDAPQMDLLVGGGEGEISSTDMVRYRLALTDTSNQPLPTDAAGNPRVMAGETVRLHGYSQDVRLKLDPPAGSTTEGQPKGVFANYMDVLYTNADLIQVRHGETQQLQFVPVDPLPGQLNPPPITGQFTLTFNGQTTGPIAYDWYPYDLAPVIQQALEGLPNIGTGNVRVSVDPVTQEAIRIQFWNSLGERDVPMITVGRSQLQNCQDAPVIELYPADLTHPGTFRSSFTAVYPFDQGLKAVSKDPEAGQPADSRSFGSVGSFTQLFSSPNPTGEFKFFHVDLQVMGGGQVAFSGNVPEDEGTETLVYPANQSNPKFIVPPDQIGFFQDMDSPLVLVITPPPMADVAGRSADDGTWRVGESTGSQFASSPWGAWPSVVDWRDVQVADVNGDGRDDIVGRRNGVWWVARSTGSGFVNERWTAWSNTITWENVLVGDFNGDGLDDIVGRANSYWWVALSTGTAFVTQRWGIWSTSSPWEDLHVADVDGDGLDDLVGRQNGVWWVAKSTGTSFVNQKWGVWSTAAPWLDVQVADVNGDGLDDIVGRQSGYWWVAKSTGTSFVNEKWGVWSANVDVRVADVDGDGRDDIVGRVGSNGDWWVARSTGSAFVNQKWGNWTPSLSWTDVQIADVNGDGRYDLVGRETASGAWWVAKSTGTNLVNETWGTWSLASTWMDVCVGDADGDGRADLLGRANGEWWVARSTGSSFDNTRWTTWPHLIPWDDVQVADVNGDGLDDLVGRNNGVWWVAKSTGSGFVNEQWTAWSVSITWEDVMVGDFNGDGLDDIVGRANSYWWVALSTGVAFATQRWGIWSTSAPWEDMLVADVDGDGRDDIVGRQNGIWWVAKSTGTSFVNQKWGVWSTSAAWLDVQVADVNGDGLADIVGRQSGYWWVAKSTGTSFVNEKWGVWSANVDVRVADVNGDGRDDIVGRVGSNGDWWVARSTGSAFVNQKWGNWSTATSWSDVQVADVNGDGRDDIMGRDAAGNWTVAKSTGTAFSNESWGNWSTSISWQDVLVGNFSNRIPGALQAEGSPLASPMSALAVTEEALPSLADAAITRFAAAAGLDEGIDSRLSITFQIADLPGTLLGQSMGQTILIDRNAAGFGWFVDLTPWDDGDFTGSTRGGDLLAAPASAADGRMDLLTVVMHELGHLLNYDHSDTGLMQPTLVPGIRRLFDTHESADDECGLLDWETLLDDQSLDDADLDAYFAAQG
jgi:hypothetical protein